MKKRENTVDKKRIEFLKTLYRREKFLFVANIVVMTITFLLLGLFISTSVGMQTAIKTLQSQAQVTLFFEDDFAEEGILQLQEKLLQDERVESVNYVSKQEAFEIFTEINKDEPILLEAISPEILPASLELRADKLASLEEFANEFEGLDGIEEVKFFKDVVDEFKFWAGVVYAVGGVLIVIFIAISLAVIVATHRITIGSKGDEIEIMKLVGATDTFITDPFIYQGMFFGIVSGGISALIIILMFLVFHLTGLFSLISSVALLPFLMVPMWVFLIILTVLLVGLGLGLGYFGSNTAVKRYLEI